MPAKVGRPKNLKKRALEDVSIRSGTANAADGASAKKFKATKVTHRSHGKAEGVVLACGEGDVGQLGLGPDVMERMRAGFVRIPDPIIQICAGGMHTVCLTNKGQLYTFGCNDEGALGRDTSEEGTETEPALVEGLEKIIQVTAGDSHTAALSEDGRVFAFGNFRDANGSMGLTKKGIQKTPIEVLPDAVVVKIASGSDHICCLTENSELFTLGCAEQGQLGRVAECFSTRGGRHGLDTILNASMVRCRKYKTRRLAKFSDVWTGQYMTFAQEKDTGDIYSWGLNNYYQLGFGDIENRFIPERVQSFAGRQWQILSGGQHHTVAMDSEGKVYTLGRADYGRLGLGEDIKTEVTEPTLVAALQSETCVDIAAGGCVSFALTNTGKIYAWGMGTSKQLGIGTEDDAWTPTQVSGKQFETRRGVMVDSGGQHTVFLAKDVEPVNGNGH
ncbi:regulator of chromosome condensation-like isoform X2 [Littorina saxatilis]|uniref:RCC1-like domain-containing protein n=1 Tax=Littorina saxatilis TaxID=31220 RepID=A0AAN9G9R7_9CAEN